MKSAGNTSLAVSLFVSATVALAQPTPAFQFHFTQQPGHYLVGISQHELLDSSRTVTLPSNATSTTASTGARPISALVWYPAEKSARKPITIGDYENMGTVPKAFGSSPDTAKRTSIIGQFMAGTEAQSTSATIDAPLHTGRFPVIVYAPSLNSPAFENIELCEYLASHGYLVIASPSIGAESPRMTVDLPGANAEAQDVLYLVGFAKTLPDADSSEFAVIGYSWGGMAALFAAARSSDIKALVSLDGSFRYGPDTVVQAGDVHPDQLKLPLLVFSRAEETLEYWAAQNKGRPPAASAPNVLNEWTGADLIHVHMLAMSHIQFSSLYQRSERFRKEGHQFSPADYSLDEGAASYNWVARYTLEFLNAYLKHDAAAMAFLKNTPAANGVPLHLVDVKFRPASNKLQPPAAAHPQ